MITLFTVSGTFTEGSRYRLSRECSSIRCKFDMCIRSKSMEGEHEMTARLLTPTMVFLFIALNATTTALASSDPPPQKTVIQACTESWANSSADSTCSNETFTKVLNYRCRVNASCQTDSGGTSSTWKTVERDDADRLVNCNGTLRLDNC